MSFQSFKEGFAKQCVASGIDPIEALDAALGKKQAGVVGDILVAQLAELSVHLVPGVFLWPLVVLPPAAGALGGAVLSGFRRQQRTTPDDIRRRR
jgi:hypothetical protein